MGFKRKSNYGIQGYDPSKKRPPMTQIDCPYCWFAHHTKNVVTRHINSEHWQEEKERKENNE